MAQKVQFLGFKRVLTGAQMQDDYLYFVRDAGELEGKIWFNGVCYGSCRDTEIDKVLEALEGFIPASGEVTNVKEYIDEAIAQLESDVTTIELGDDSFSGLTLVENSSTSGKLDYTLTLTNVAPADEFRQEIADREDADKALQAELDAVEVAVGLSSAGTHVQSSGRFTSAATTVEAEIAALDAALQNVADQTIVEGSSTEDYVKLDVATEDGVTTISINDSALTAAIEAMDLAQVHETGKAIVAVSEEDGKVSASAGTVAAQYVDVADAAGKFTGTTVEAILAEIDSAYKAADEAIVGDATTSGNTLGKLEDRIEALDADAKEYHIVKTTTGLPEAIKERYSLVDADGNVSGDTVDIPKDSHIVSITYITDPSDEHYQNLEYVYIDASGDTQTTYVDMSELVLETEFASGVTVTDGIAHGVVDPQSEDFLTVGANGFKLSGVQDAIDDAVEKEEEARKKADSAITENLETTATTLVQMIEDAKKAATTKVVEGTDNEHLTITSGAAADSSITYTITLTDVASATALTAEENARISGDTELQENIQTTADTLTAMIDDLTDGLQAELDAVEISLGFTDTAYTNSGTYICGTSVTNDIKLLDTALDTVEGNFTDALARETELRASGDTALDERLDKIEDEYITAVTVNGVDATVANNAAGVTIDARNIELGEAVTGSTGGVSFPATANTQDIFQEIVDVLNRSVAGSYTGVTSADNSITITEPNANGQDLSVNVKTLQLADVQAGETEVKKDESTGALYGVMYWIDEETA